MQLASRADDIWIGVIGAVVGGVIVHHYAKAHEAGVMSDHPFILLAGLAAIGAVGAVLISKAGSVPVTPDGSVVAQPAVTDWRGFYAYYNQPNRDVAPVFIPEAGAMTPQQQLFQALSGGS